MKTILGILRAELGYLERKFLYFKKIGMQINN